MIGISIDLVTPHNFLFGDDIVWTKYTRSFSDFAVGATSATSILYAVQPNQVTHAVILKPQVAFNGAGITSATASVGLSGQATKYASAFSLLSVGSSTSSDNFGLWKESFAVSQNVIVTVTSNILLNTLTAGSFDIWVYTSSLP